VGTFTADRACKHEIKSMGTVSNRKREFGIQLKLPFISRISMMYDVGLLLKSFV